MIWHTNEKEFFHTEFFGFHCQICLVEDLGPLWIYSCFPFENVNGHLMELFHGTQNVELQILSSVNVFQNMPDMITSIKDQTYVEFIEKLRHKPVGRKISPTTSSGSFPIGQPAKKLLRQYTVCT
jgi:hypothetical protein